MNKLKVLSVAIFLAAVVLLGTYVVKSRTQGGNVAPAFSVEGDSIEVSVHDTEEALLKGVTASDQEDGDLTDSVIVESISRFNEDGSRTVTYAVIDSDNNVAHASRELRYSDYTPTQFTLRKPLAFGIGATNMTAALSAEDCLDGDITTNIRLVSEDGIEVMLPGSYSAAIQATNSAGDTSVLPVTVEIYASEVRSTMPVINLNEYIVYIPKGTAFDASALLKSVTINGTDYTVTKGAGTYGNEDADAAGPEKTVSIDSIEIQNNVKTDVPGNYEVLYTFSDRNRNTGTVRLYVVVTEGGT